MTTLGIIGTGLIGGSIGMRAREFGWRVIGCDADPSAAQEALRCGAVDEVVTREAIGQRAGVVVIAAHVSGTLAEIERMRCTKPRNARLIIDVSSVKAPIVRAAHGVRNFVATHPMAGRERSGPSLAARDAFEGKTWLYVPTGRRELDVRAAEFIGAFGAVPVEVDAQEHDRTVAFTSHLPQILATLFAARCHPQASNDGPAGRSRLEPFMGPAARELLRLSRSSAAMWRDILNANRVNICSELRALAFELDRVANALDTEVNIY